MHLFETTLIIKRSYHCKVVWMWPSLNHIYRAFILGSWYYLWNYLSI